MSQTLLFWVMFISQNSDMLEKAAYSLLNYLAIIIRHCGFHFRSTDLADKPHSQDSGSICKQTWINTLL